MVNDKTTEYQMYQANELDVSDVPPELAEQLKDNEELRIDDQAGLYFYRFNTSMEPFTNAKIRRAFGLAVNQEEIVEYITKNGEKPAHGFVAYGFKGPDGKEFRDSVGKLVEFNPEEAKKLLEEGMKEEGYTELPKVVMTYSTSPSTRISRSRCKRCSRRRLVSMWNCRMSRVESSCPSRRSSNTKCPVRPSCMTTQIL